MKARRRVVVGFGGSGQRATLNFQVSSPDRGIVHRLETALRRTGRTLSFAAWSLVLGHWTLVILWSLRHWALVIFRVIFSALRHWTAGSPDFGRWTLMPEQFLHPIDKPFGKFYSGSDDAL